MALLFVNLQTKKHRFPPFSLFVEAQILMFQVKVSKFYRCPSQVAICLHANSAQIAAVPATRMYGHGQPGGGILWGG